MPYSEVRFMSKNQQYEKFEEWTKNILTQLDMPKKLHDLGITRSITQARRMVVEWNSGDLEFLISRWSIEMHTFIPSWGEFSLTLEDVCVLTSLPIIGDAQVATSMPPRRKTRRGTTP